MSNNNCEYQKNYDNIVNRGHKLEGNPHKTMPQEVAAAAATSAEEKQFQSGELLYSESEKFRPKSPLKENKLLDFICTSIYSYMLLATIAICVTLITLLFTKYYYVTIIYLVWLYLDRNTCNRGGRRWNIIYKSNFYKRIASYFRMKMRYSNNFQLDTNENYLLVYHPHAVSAFGCVCAFASDGMNLNERFPGIESKFLVHETSFLFPVMKELFSSRGDCSVNSKSIDYLLSDQQKKGQLLALVVGGLCEMDLSDSEILKLVIANRKGFVKKALQHGAHIVPCIGFGENSVFYTIKLRKNSLWAILRENFYNAFHFKHPCYYGRSFFSANWFGFIPYKRPITVAMGDPIRVTKCECPTIEQIDELHKRYLEAVKTLYKSNSDLCDKFDRQLELI